jgi:drug/metabolite transporter (DMT)-like permease
MLASAVIFAVACAATGRWTTPVDGVGWASFVWASLAAAIALLAMFVSAGRIGPFRTALIMNIEPLAAIVLAYFVLGESMNAMQWAGATVMLGALFWFQLRR